MKEASWLDGFNDVSAACLVISAKLYVQWHMANLAAMRKVEL